jgi:glycerol kinase
LKIAGLGQQEFSQHYPYSGWVEHDPEDLWRTSVETAKAALAKARISALDLAAVGITNQRETTLVWDRATGKPIANAIVWQDRRTAEMCARLREEGHEPRVTAKTGLLLDPYFSATKIAWILDSVPGARESAERGELAFGTVDSYLIWRFTGGRSHLTDATNASRTLLFDIRSGRWDDELLSLFRVPKAMMPEVRDCASEFGATDASVLGASAPFVALRATSRRRRSVRPVSNQAC